MPNEVYVLIEGFHGDWMLMGIYENLDVAQQRAHEAAPKVGQDERRVHLNWQQTQYFPYEHEALAHLSTGQSITVWEARHEWVEPNHDRRETTRFLIARLQVE